MNSAFNKNPLSFEVQSELVIETNLLEFEYEVWGLPIIQINNNKAKLLIGKDKYSKSVYGWLNLKQNNIDYYLWNNFLLKKDLFIIDNKNIKFYNKPNGKIVLFKIYKKENKLSNEQELNYILHPLEIKGIWMKVLLVTPSNYCNEKTKNTRETIVWIKYINNDGKLNVWYYPRGC